jgi:hypothetical protein
MRSRSTLVRGLALPSVVVLGLVLGRWLSPAPLHAAATDHGDTFALATGQVDNGIDAVFMLDFLSGDLRVAVLNPTTRGFTVTYHRNISADLKVEAGKTPKYALVVGQSYMRTFSNWRLAPCAIYVAEVTSGNLAVYTFAYNTSMTSRPGAMPPQPIVPLLVLPFRSAVVRN